MAQIAQEKGLLPGGSIPPPPLMGGGPPPPPPFGKCTDFMLVKPIHVYRWNSSPT